jgi:hypothetical protein
MLLRFALPDALSFLPSEGTPQLPHAGASNRTEPRQRQPTAVPVRLRRCAARAEQVGDTAERATQRRAVGRPRSKKSLAGGIGTVDGE